MNFLIINYSINWVYLLYEEYIVSFKDFINIYYNNDNNDNINIEIKHFDIENLNLIEFENMNFLKYDKIFYTGNLTILKLLIEKINYDFDKIYYINIEQMSIPSYFKLLKTIDNRINIIDYSEENIPFLKEEYKNIYLFPPFFKAIEINNEKDIDILSITNNNYRENIINDINNDIDNDNDNEIICSYINSESNEYLNNYKKIYLNGCYGKTRDDFFLRTKIYINIHCSDVHQTMELIRIVNLIMNKVIILSQKSICTELLFLKDYIIICNDTNDFKTKIKDILKNYDLYYNKIYGNYDSICKKYYEYIKNNLDKII